MPRPASRVIGIDHISVRVSDYEKSKKFYAGLFASVFSVMSKRSLGCVEMQCYSTGDDHCRFVVADYERVNAAAFWRSEGATARDIMKKLSEM